MPFTLTKAQQAVVENEGGALLVSAAAGSGKTRVLIDRLLRKIADGANIDDFLIITYTNAAAAELRAKISAALSERLAVQPENRHLQRQLTRIYLTQISTVHAFCANILRRYAHTMDLPPDFRVAEEYEMQLLRDRVLDDVLEEAYAHLGEQPDVAAAIDRLGYGRDDRRLAALVLRLYDSVRCQVDPAAKRHTRISATPGRRRGAFTGWSGCMRAQTTQQCAYRMPSCSPRATMRSRKNTFRSSSGILKLSEPMRP